MYEDDILQNGSVSDNDIEVYTDTGTDVEVTPIPTDDIGNGDILIEESVSGNNAESSNDVLEIGSDGSVSSNGEFETVVEVSGVYYPEDYVTSTQANAILYSIIVIFVYIVFRDLFKSFGFERWHNEK